MQPSIHIYDAQYLGTPAHGQLVTFDSLVCSGAEVSRYSTQISLRPDVSFNPQAVEQLDCFDLDLGGGITEYQWSRKAQSLFERPGTLHIGLGNTSVIDHFIRFALYRCLSTLPNTELPAGAHYLDLLTVCLAVSILRPESMPFTFPTAWPLQRKREYALRQIEGESRAEGVLGLAKALSAANPKLMAHAIAHSSPGDIAKLFGLVDGQVESLGSLKPVFVCHDQLMAAGSYGVFLALGTDPQYKNFVYMIDLQCDLSELIEDGGESVSRFIRTDASQLDRPVVRVNLNRVPFVSPMGVVDKATASRLRIDPRTIKMRAAQLQSLPDLCLALLEVSGASEASLNADPDYQLYGAEYLPPDIALLQRLHGTEQKDWAPMITAAHDARITALGMRLIRRCEPALLSDSDKKLWRAHCASRLLGRADASQIAAAQEYCKRIAGAPVYPQGMRAAALHWLDTIENGNEPSINV